MREWWFWGLIGGVGAAAFFGWKLWRSGHQIGGTRTEEEGWEGYGDFEEEAALRRLKADREAIRGAVDRYGLED